ncbi:MAG TPA: hypothetical protein PKV72_05610 [Candidatus Peribacteria bacterium]|nr:hypothetical protein [Candidatus Peribacteria bacterium]
MTTRNAAGPGRRTVRELVGTVVLSLVILGALIAGMMWFYARSNAILTQEVRERLQTYAALAAMQFRAEDLALIRGPQDAGSAVFKQAVARAESIRAGLPDVAFLYVMRKTDTPDRLSFVVENDMLHTQKQMDLNGDGIIEADEEVPAIGDPFDASAVPALQGPAFEGPTADREITRDQWGWWMSGYAPIRDTGGNTVAVLGLDMHADRFMATTRRIFSPPALLVSLLTLLLMMGGFFGFLSYRRLKLMETLDAQRRAMVTVASHKLGGPIATVRWWIELLDGDVLRQPVELQEAKKELSGAVERLSEVMGHLEDATQMESTDPKLWRRLATETQEELSGKR